VTKIEGEMQQNKDRVICQLAKVSLLFRPQGKKEAPHGEEG